MGQEECHPCPREDEIEAKVEPEPCFQKKSLHRKFCSSWEGRARREGDLGGTCPPLNQWRKIGGLVLKGDKKRILAKITGRTTRGQSRENDEPTSATLRDSGK